MINAFLKKFFGRSPTGDTLDRSFLPDVEAAGFGRSSSISGGARPTFDQDTFHDAEGGELLPQRSAHSGWDAALMPGKRPSLTGARPSPLAAPPLAPGNSNHAAFPPSRIPAMKQRRPSYADTTATTPAFFNTTSIPAAPDSALTQPAAVEGGATIPTAQPEAQSASSSTDGQDASLPSLATTSARPQLPPSLPTPPAAPYQRNNPPNLYAAQQTHAAYKGQPHPAFKRRALIGATAATGYAPSAYNTSSATPAPSAQSGVVPVQPGVFGTAHKTAADDIFLNSALLPPATPVSLSSKVSETGHAPPPPLNPQATEPGTHVLTRDTTQPTTDQDAPTAALQTAPSTETVSTAPNSADSSKTSVQPAVPPPPHKYPHAGAPLLTPIPPPPVFSQQAAYTPAAVFAPPVAATPADPFTLYRQAYRQGSSGGGGGPAPDTGAWYGATKAAGKPPVAPAGKPRLTGPARRAVCPTVAPQAVNPGPSPREEASFQAATSYSNAFWEATHQYRRSSGGGTDDGLLNTAALPAVCAPAAPPQPATCGGASGDGAGAASQVPALHRFSAPGFAGVLEGFSDVLKDSSVSTSVELPPKALQRGSSSNLGHNLEPGTAAAPVVSGSGSDAPSGPPVAAPHPAPSTASSGCPSTAPSEAPSLDRAGSAAFLSPRFKMMPPGSLQHHPPPHISYKELELLQEIGEGGFGKVYHARWRGKHVAVKVATRKEGHSSGCVKEFETEVHTMCSIPPHVNIVRLLAICKEPPHLALVTDHCSQGSLYNLLHNQQTPPWNLQQLLGVWLGVAQGMDHLHSCNPPVLHRDLKSANVLLDAHGCVKICDFGLSKITSDVNAMTGGLGTYQWMAPEVLAHQRYSFKADVYSFGIVMWECLTRELPFSSMQVIQAAVSVVNKGLRPDMPPGTPKELSDLIKACWAPVADQRPNFSHVAATLAALLRTWPASLLNMTPWKQVEHKPAARAPVVPAHQVQAGLPGRRSTDVGSDGGAPAPVLVSSVPKSGSTCTSSQAATVTPTPSAARPATSAGSDGHSGATPALTCTPLAKGWDMQQQQQESFCEAGQQTPAVMTRQTPVRLTQDTAQGFVVPPLPITSSPVSNRFRPEAAGEAGKALTDRKPGVWTKAPATNAFAAAGRKSWGGHVVGQSGEMQAGGQWPPGQALLAPVAVSGAAFPAQGAAGLNRGAVLAQGSGVVVVSAAGAAWGVRESWDRESAKQQHQAS